MKVTAHEFSRRVGEGLYYFGTDRKSAVDAIRALADRIESGETLFVGTHVVSRVKSDGWCDTKLILSLMEK